MAKTAIPSKSWARRLAEPLCASWLNSLSHTKLRWGQLS